MEKIIDISRKISSNMVMWPGDDAPKISKKCSINKGDCCNLSSIEMNLHIGTHIDAPFHFIDGGKSISSLDLSYFIGNVKVFELDVENYIDKKDLINLDILKGDKIFFKTKNFSATVAVLAENKHSARALFCIRQSRDLNPGRPHARSTLYRYTTSDTSNFCHFFLANFLDLTF